MPQAYVRPRDRFGSLLHRVAMRLAARFPQLARRLQCSWRIVRLRGDLPAGFPRRGHAETFCLRPGTSDWLVLEEIFLHGEYVPLLEKLCEDAGGVRQVLDLGANAGYSMRLWHRAFPGARIVGVEPDAGNCAVCRRNMRSIGRDVGAQLQLIEAAVVGRAQAIVLDRSGGEWAFRTRQAAPHEAGEVSALTVPQILEAASFTGQIDVLKCDIESAESELFSHCAPWISRVRHLIVELHDPYDYGSLCRDLERCGGRFQPYFRDRRADTELVLLEQRLSIPSTEG